MAQFLVSFYDLKDNLVGRKNVIASNGGDALHLGCEWYKSTPNSEYKPLDDVVIEVRFISEV